MNLFEFLDKLGKELRCPNIQRVNKVIPCDNSYLNFVDTWRCGRIVKLGFQEKIYLKKNHMPASVAQLDGCPTGDQEVAGSTPAGLASRIIF